MKQQATFIGWDFDAVWRIVEDVTYPILKWQPLTADEIIAADRDALGWDDIKGENSTEDNITADLILPTTGTKGSTIS